MLVEFQINGLLRILVTESNLFRYVVIGQILLMSVAGSLKASY